MTWIIARQMTMILNTISFDRWFGLSSAEWPTELADVVVDECCSDSCRNMHRLKSCRVLWQICWTYLPSDLNTRQGQDATTHLQPITPNSLNYQGLMEFKFEFYQDPTIFSHPNALDIHRQFLVEFEFGLASRNSQLFWVLGLQNSTKW